ncbi:MAG: hypothetical protein J6J41_07565 [Clostridia bacterium]|nr:hypothetical protein [Clostridia bacterium]
MSGTEKQKKEGFIRRIVSDSFWSIFGLVLMNAMAQFAVYPVWNSRLGNAAYGDILYLLSAMNVLAVSMGVSCNYARMTASAYGETKNGIYLKLMAGVSLGMIPYMLTVIHVSGIHLTPLETGLLILLAIASQWRFYSDVEYKLRLNYRAYFVYYLVISCGYGVGIILFLRTGLWPLALLPGELAGLALVAACGKVYRPDDGSGSPEESRAAVRAVLTLLGTEMVSNLIYNGDRFLLKNLLDASAVTLYYQASLLGKIMSLLSQPLNSVLIGYLARYRENLSRKMMGMVALGAFGLFVLGTAVCSAASHLVIPALYPANYETVRGFFLQANGAQAAYFVSGIVATVLLRFFDVRYQVYVNAVYAALFVACCIPGTMAGGFSGFCIALLAVSLLRLGFALMLGFLGVRKNEAGNRVADE